MNCTEAFRSVGSPKRHRLKKSFSFFSFYTPSEETFVSPHGCRTRKLGSIIVNLKFILILGTFLILADSRLESRE